MIWMKASKTFQWMPLFQWPRKARHFAALELYPSRQAIFQETRVVIHPAQVPEKEFIASVVLHETFDGLHTRLQPQGHQPQLHDPSTASVKSSGRWRGPLVIIHFVGPFVNGGETNTELNHRPSLAMPRKVPQPPWSSASFLVALLPAGHNLDLQEPGKSAIGYGSYGSIQWLISWYRNHGIFSNEHEGVILEHHPLSLLSGIWTRPLGLPIWHQS